MRKNYDPERRDVTQDVLSPLNVSLHDPGTQTFSRYEESKIYNWSWHVNILTNGDIIVTLTECPAKDQKNSLSKDFTFTFEEICKELEKFSVDTFSLPTILGRKSRYYESIMKEIDESLREEARFLKKNEIPEGILVEVPAGEHSIKTKVEVSRRYERAVEAVAKWRAVYRAINNHGNYDAPYGGRLFNFGRVICPTYFEAIPPV